MLDDFHGCHPQVPTLVGFHCTQVLDGVCAFEVCLGHRAADGEHGAVLNIGDGEFCIVFCVRDHTTQPDTVEDGLNGWQEVAKLEVAVASELVHARLLQLRALKFDAGLHQFFVYAHCVAPSLLTLNW